MGFTVRLALAVALFALAAALPARATQYEVEIDVEHELDLYELARSNQISPATLETLVELLQDGVDLNTASREELYELPNVTYAEVDAIVEYRKAAGHIADPAELVKAGALSKRLLLQIAPFLIASEDPRGAQPVSGVARLEMGYTPGDSPAPPLFLKVDARGFHGLSAGVLAMTVRRRLGEVGWDASPRLDRVGSLVASPPAKYGVQVPKYYLSMKTGTYSFVVGSYRIGFAQRLTLDNTLRYTPDGFYPDNVVVVPTDLDRLCRMSAGELLTSPCAPTAEDPYTHYATSDFAWRDGFRGLAAGVTGLPVGRRSLSAYAFGSYQRRSIYQYEIYDPTLCFDPRDDADPACAAPPVYVRQDNPASPSPKFAFSTLPDMFDEMAAGGHVGFKLARAAALGATGYYARDFWRIRGASLDFQEWSRYPNGGSFGAVGADASFGVDAFRFFVEAARSFDATLGGGGFGVLQRSVASWKRQELELSLRYYDPKFANPYARAQSAPDKFEGLLARNEGGARLRYVGKRLDDWWFHIEADFWALPGDAGASDTAGRANLDLYARADFRGLRLLQPTLWLEYRNKDLGRGGRGQCFEVSILEDERGEPIPCSGERFRASGRVGSQVLRWLTLYAQYQHVLVDDARYKDRLRQDQLAWIEAVAKPVPPLRIRVRTRYKFEDISDDTYLERSLWTQAEVTWLWGRLFAVQLRYDNLAYIDRRESTLVRRPSPENRLRLEIEARF